MKYFLDEGDAMNAVITMDVIGSKELFSRGYSKDEFYRSAGRASEVMAGRLLTRFTISRGDEIQGVILNPEDIPEVVRNLRYFFLPAKLRIGIGIGTVDEPVVYGNSWEMDGQAFHRAREALDAVKDIRVPCTRVVSGYPDTDSTADVIFLLIDAIKSKWTLPQWEAVYAYESCGTYRAAGEMLGVAAQNVAKRCKAAMWNSVKEGEKHMASLFGTIGRDES